MKTLKQLKRGDMFTKKEIFGEPKDNQIFIRGDYICSIKRIEVYRYSDVNDFEYLNPNKIIYEL